MGRDGTPDRPGADLTLTDLVNRHAGAPAVIVGNGPSLNRTDPWWPEGTVVFAFNGAWRLHLAGRLTPTWHVVEDRLVVEEEAAALRAIDWAPLVVPRDHRDIIPPGPGRVHVPVDWSFYDGVRAPAVPGFATTGADPLFAGQSVAYLALQLAFLMGCDPVYLVGVDLDYRIPVSARVSGRVVTSTGPDPNHHDPDYFGPGRRWHLPKPDRMLAAFRHAAAVYTCHGRRLVNATPGGRLTGVPRGELQVSRSRRREC